MDNTPEPPEKIPQNPNPVTPGQDFVQQQPQPQQPQHPQQTQYHQQPNQVPAQQATQQPTSYQQTSQQHQQYQQTPQQQVAQATPESQVLNPEVDKVHSKKPSKWSKYSGLMSVGQLVLGAVLLAVLINSFVFQSYQVFGESMTETLKEGDRLIVSKIGKSISGVVGDYQPRRGEIVVFKSPLNPDVQLIKRVIAFPGERVVVVDGKITVFNDENPNGFNPDETFDAVLPPNTSGNIDTVVGEDELFVSGDNRRLGGSLDSRNELGNIPIENVVGELVLRIFPLGQASFF